MADPQADADHERQHVDHVTLDVAMLDGSAEAEMAPLLPSSSSGEQLAHDVVPGDSSRPAAPVSVPPEDPDPLEDLINKELERVTVLQEVRSGQEPPSIFRVHPSIRKQESEAYEPNLISIGPLHRSKQSLLPMEDVKLRCLQDLLDRHPDNKLRNYIRVIRDCEPQARQQYAEQVEPDVDKLVTMLVVDGCFIIEYLTKRVFKQAAILFSGRWGLSHLRRDLMLLENQIPFFVLIKLFEQSIIPFRGKRPQPLTLIEMALRFLNIKLPEERHPHPDQVLHLLHLHHICLNPERTPDEPTKCSQMILYPLKKATSLISGVFLGILYIVLLREWPWRCFSGVEIEAFPRMIPCATELDKAGVKFKKKVIRSGSGVNCYLKVSFIEGTLEIPFLAVEEATSSKLRNFIALEQCCPKVGSYFTSYGIFMDNIINTRSDVIILQRSRIIESKLGSEEDVTKLFNELCKGTHLNYQSHYNAPLFKTVNEYCGVSHHRWRADLKSTYLSSPWTTISLLAGVFLLFLTASQTYFTVWPRK